MIVVGAPIAKTTANAASTGPALPRRDPTSAAMARATSAGIVDEQHLPGTERYPRRVDAEPDEVHDQQAEHNDGERWNNASQRTPIARR